MKLTPDSQSQEGDDESGPDDNGVENVPKFLKEVRNSESVDLWQDLQGEDGEEEPLTAVLQYCSNKLVHFTNMDKNCLLLQNGPAFRNSSIQLFEICIEVQ